MSKQIKFYRLLPWAVAAVIVIAVTFAVSFLDFNSLYNYSLMPWENAQGIDTVRAINEFGEGIPDLAAYWESRIAALAGLLVLFVIGPSLWIYSEIQNQAKVISSRDDELKKGFVWYAGVMIVIAGLLYAVPVTAVKGYQFQNIWDSAAKSRNLDELRSELSTLAFDTAEKYYLSYNSNKKGGFHALTLRNLDNYTSIAGNSKNSFVLAPVKSDSMITIYGVGYKHGTDPEFENANGEQGKLQIAVEVDPMNDIINFVRTNTNSR